MSLVVSGVREGGGGDGTKRRPRPPTFVQHLYGTWGRKMLSHKDGVTKRDRITLMPTEATYKPNNRAFPLLA